MKNIRFLTLNRLPALILLAGLVMGCVPGLPITGNGGESPQPIPPTEDTSSGSTPAVTVVDQAIDGTTVTVGDVVSVGPGWMVIHSQQNGSTGPAIGFTAVKDGDNKDVKVTIDPAQATPVLYAMLHIDAGEVGKYEFPGPDTPVFVNGEMVSPKFNASASGGAQADVTPSLNVEKQTVTE